MTADVVFLVSGIALLAAVVLPSLLHKAAISAPIVLLAMGMLIGLLPTPDGLVLDPVENRAVVEHVTEVTVLLALMGVGLALDRPLDLRSWSSIRRWSATWRLLLLAMPLCIGAVALLGWGLLGLAPATALLLGAVLAPTDPVLASDIQVEGPVTEGHEDEIDEEDEVRFALTSEAGLNDGLAFPFVYAAILAATEGAFASWGAGWFGWELVGKVAVGVLTGLAVGWVLAKIAFRAPSPSLRMAEQGEPLLAFAALLLAYGTSEVLHGYGFLAVFVAAMTLRSAERGNEYHEHMHQVVERLERLMTLFVLLLLGMALTHGLLAHLDWRGALLALVLVLVVRPLSALLALRVGHAKAKEVSGLDSRERLVTAFFGVRGIGSLYYLAYATGAAAFDGQRWLWSTVAFTIVLSVILHGVLATPAMARLEKRRKERGKQVRPRGPGGPGESGAGAGTPVTSTA